MTTGEIGSRDEALSEPIYWRGRQWAVTAYGVERRAGAYAISADVLCRRGVNWWVEHMALKPWVDMPDFAEALRIARRQVVIV